MPNYFTDNSDLLFQFERFDLQRTVAILEDDYKQSDVYDYAPRNYQEAMEYYRGALELVGDLSANYLEPRAEANDREGAELIDGEVKYAKGTLESIQKLAESELMGVLLPREFGGGNVPASIYTMMIEMLSQADPALMTMFGYQDVGEAIAKYASPDVAKKYLEKYCKGEHIGAMVLTEPHAGSDLQSAKLKAYQDDQGNWFLKGTKCFISNGCGDVLLVLARSEPNTNNMFGLSMFVCHGGDKVKVGRVEEKLGLHASPTCELHFEDAPAELVGKRRFGLVQVLHTLNHARYSVAAQALGIAEAAYQAALEWAKDRVAFGTPIYEKPAVANMLMNMRVDIESSRSLLYKSVQTLDLKNKLEEHIEHLKQNKQPVDAELNKELAALTKQLDMESPMVKYVVTECANKVCFDALQIHGGSGYIKEYKIERLCRDVRITNIYEGTSQVQVLGAFKGAWQDLSKDFIERVLQIDVDGDVQEIVQKIKKIRNIYDESKSLLSDYNNKQAKEVAYKELVDIYCSLITACILVEESQSNTRKSHILKRYVLNALAQAQKGITAIQEKTYCDLESQQLICE